MRKTSSRSSILGVAVAAVSVVALTACATEEPPAGDGELTPITVMLGYSYTGVYSPLFEGVEQGFFADLGIDLTIEESTGSSAASIALEGGKVDFAMLNSPSAWELIDKDAEIRGVAQVGQTGGLSFMSLKESGIEGPEDLEGTTIGDEAGESLAGSLMPTFFENNGIDPSTIEIVHMDAAVMESALTAGHVDVLAGYSQSTGVRMQYTGVEFNEISWDDYDLPLVTYGLFTRDATIESDPELVRAMVAGVVESYTHSRDNQEETIETAFKLFPQVPKEMAALQLAWVMTPQSLGDERRGDHPIGWMDPAHMTRVLELSGNKSTDPATYYTSEFLPEG